MTCELVHEFPHPLMFEKTSPCISIYMPTHLHVIEQKQDRIRFKILIKACEEQLKIRFDEETAVRYLKALIELEQDDDFWLNPAEGLVLFCDQKQCIVYKLQSSIEPLAIVSDSFHIKPLLQYFQFPQKIQVLGIDAKTFALFEGDRYGIKPVEMDKEAPTTLKSAIGIHWAEPYISKGSYGTSPGMVHGQGGAKDEKERSIEKFFRVVDKYVYETFSKESKCPLILVALNEHHSVFRTISDNPYLMKEGIKGDYESFTMKELCEKVNALFEPINKQKIQDKLDRYQAALSESKGSQQIREITKAALDGRIETLLVEENKIIKGKINPVKEKVDFKDPDKVLLDDVLDDLAEQVLKDRGEVILVPKTMFDNKFGIGAIFRY